MAPQKHPANRGAHRDYRARRHAHAPRALGARLLFVLTFMAVGLVVPAATAGYSDQIGRIDALTAVIITVVMAAAVAAYVNLARVTLGGAR